MSKETIERRRRSAALAAAVTAVHTADLPDAADPGEVIARFSKAADEFIDALERGLPALTKALQRELAGIERDIKIAGAGEPPSTAINSGFKLPDDEPSPTPPPDGPFRLPSDAPKPADHAPGPFTLPDGDDD